MLKLLKAHFIVLISLLAASQSYATVWRVNNNSNSTAQFTDIQVAVDNALAGDIIHLEGNSILGGVTAAVPYTPVVVDKALHFIGPGYFLSQNNPSANVIQSAICEQFSFVSGSEGSVVEGIIVHQLNINVNNITIKKNRIHHIDIINASNCIFGKNFVEGLIPFDPVINILGGGGHLFASNYITHDPTFTSGQFVINEANTNLNEYRNNVIKNAHSITNEAFFHNNIFIAHVFESIELGTFNNNIFGSGENPVSDFDPQGNANDPSPITLVSSNQLDVDISILFVGGSNGTLDTDYELQIASPALGAGDNGEDIGMYPVTNPYEPSGLPDIPILSIFNSNDFSNTYLIPLAYLGFSPDGQIIMDGEYYLDLDPGFGNGTVFTFPNGPIVDGNLAIDIQGVPSGSHILGFRVHDVLDQWSHDVEHQFQIENPSLTPEPALQSMEYFIDIDNGYETGTVIDNPFAGDTDGNFLTSIDFVGITPGLHNIGYRALDEEGDYGTTYITPVLILPQENQAPPVVFVEYFFDNNDGGFGVSEFGFTVDNDFVELPIFFPFHNLQPGLHQLHLRPMNAAGEWGTTLTKPILVTPDQEVLVDLDHFEYFLDDDPGFGDGTIITIPPGEPVFEGTLAIDLLGQNLGEHDLFLRIVDVEGNWSTSHIEVILVNTECEQVDLDGTGTVDIGDLLVFLGDFGCTDSPCIADFNMDGVTDSSDLIFFLGYFSQTCQ